MGGVEPAQSVSAVTGYHSDSGRPSGLQHVPPSATQMSPQQRSFSPQRNSWPCLFLQVCEPAGLVTEPAQSVSSVTGYHALSGCPCGLQHLLPSAAHAFPQHESPTPQAKSLPSTFWQQVPPSATQMSPQHVSASAHSNQLP